MGRFFRRGWGLLKRGGEVLELKEFDPLPPTLFVLPDS